ncbi:MAG: heparan-alpha-glucosaminide N-acetyltransferase domain-containing protein [Chitinophagaceae bacterium]
MKITKERFLSLDIFRGITVLFMIIVNSLPSEEIAYAPFLHAQWFGFTPTDLVYPSFLFAIGNSIYFGSVGWKTQPSRQVYGKILKRSVFIFLIGYLMYWFPFVQYNGRSWHWIPMSGTRIMGVLQRIAVAFLVSSLMIYKLKERFLYIFGIVLLVGYPFLLFHFGYSGKDSLSLEGNAVLRLDAFVFGEAHLYKGEVIPFDPEGLLSTLPSIVNVLIGFLAGKYLLENKTNYKKLLKLTAIGFFLVAVGYLWGYSFPIGKKLWTSSFVMLTTGLDILLLLSIVCFCEERNKSKFASFVLVLGKNPLAIYIFSQLFLTVLYMIRFRGGGLYDVLFSDFFIKLGGKFGCLLQSLLYTMLCWLLGFILDKKKIYIKL